ncbi:MAG TPA: hypothetical protein VEZ47_04835, partial [Gemmatirosa sp.]|nr:hypothetical protein [Gemmatirosa sp.]
MTPFCAAIQAFVSAPSRSSSQRYGSATRVPWYSSTWSTVFVVGYCTRADLGVDVGAGGDAAGACWAPSRAPGARTASAASAA